MNSCISFVLYKFCIAILFGRGLIAIPMRGRFVSGDDSKFRILVSMPVFPNGFNSFACLLKHSFYCIKILTGDDSLKDHWIEPSYLNISLQFIMMVKFAGNECADSWILKVVWFSSFFVNWYDLQIALSFNKMSHFITFPVHSELKSMSER